MSQGEDGPLKRYVSRWCNLSMQYYEANRRLMLDACLQNERPGFQRCLLPTRPTSFAQIEEMVNNEATMMRGWQRKDNHQTLYQEVPARKRKWKESSAVPFPHQGRRKRTPAPINQIRNEKKTLFTQIIRNYDFKMEKMENIYKKLLSYGEIQPKVSRIYTLRDTIHDLLDNGTLTFEGKEHAQKVGTRTIEMERVPIPFQGSMTLSRDLLEMTGRVTSNKGRAPCPK
ncbi:hypothetical protein MRB53_030234 [Persea americana]|uniref:Uncharacterized protein n=1 Tax=Persea americana TaxID=3435 RepID=A0ACC2KKN9_PERAE|nr:hypothetical protein MRB53_030234 [Persea americana]